MTPKRVLGTRRSVGAIFTAALLTCASFTASYGGEGGDTGSIVLAAAIPVSLDPVSGRADQGLDSSLYAANESLPGLNLGATPLQAPASLQSPVSLQALPLPALPVNDPSPWSVAALDSVIRSASAPLSTRYDSHGNVIVDMSYWDTADSSLRMVYGNRLRSQPATPSAEKLDEQVGIDLNLALGTGLFHLRTERGLAAAGAGNTMNDDSLTSLQYGYSANLGKLRYGADYVQAGNAYSDFLKMGGAKPVRDQESTTVWTRVPLNHRVSLQASTEESRKDLDGARNQPHYIDELTGLKAHFVLANRPYLGSSLWYREGLRSADYVPEGQTYGDGDVRSSGAAFEMRNDWGTHSITASQAVTYGGAAGWTDQNISQSLASTLYPYNWLTFGLDLSSSEDSTRSSDGPWSGRHRSKALWASYNPPAKSFTVTCSGYSDSYSTGDGSTRYSESYTNFTVAFDRFSVLETRMPLALTLQFSAYADEVYSSQNTNDVTLWLRFGRGGLIQSGAREWYLAEPERLTYLH
ncbi:MAG TPA: hypothetical protein VFY39_04010 [Gammaproteobacteria bacterium]|nr:hypothetical protein [Gammaproteobacteria bacterium]